MTKVRPPLTVLFFDGCPNFEALKAILKHEGITSYAEVNLEHLFEGDPRKRYSSPTLLYGDSVVLGTMTSNQSLSCSYLPNEQMAEIVRREKSRLLAK